MADDRFPDSFASGLDDVHAELKRVGDLADSVGRSLSNAFRGAVLDGKSLKSVLADVSKAFADIALRAALKPVGSLISSAVESLFTATNPTLGGVTAFAKGGVVSAPSYFPTGSGLALAGEAGPEAIVPLARGSDGRLGINMTGSGAPNITVQIATPDASSFRRSETYVTGQIARAVARGQRGM